MSKLLTVKDVCRISGVSRSTAIRWIECGELKAFKVGSRGRLWRVRERELQRFIRAQQAKS